MLKPGHMLSFYGNMPGDTKLTTEVKQVMLDFSQQCLDFFRNVRRDDHTQHAVQLIGGAIRSHPQACFRHPSAVTKAGGTCIAGASVDFC